METVKVDSASLKEVGDSIVLWSGEYKEVITAIFDKINSYGDSGLWVGNSSTNYINSVNSEKSVYDAIGNIMKSYGNSLIYASENYDSFAKKCDRHVKDIR